MMQGIKNTSNDTFQRLMGNGFRYEVPKYQRDYSWTSEQWSDLWYDIQQMLAENESHYMGYLVLQTSDDRNFYIIDGQQRLTTMCILIIAVIYQLKALPASEDEKKANELRANSLHSSFIGNLDMMTLTSVNKLVLNRNNDRFYKTYLTTLQPYPRRGLTASEKLLKNAFEFFCNYLNDTYHTTEELVNFIDKVVNNIFFTVITVSDELNAFKVFETLNARGVQLSSSDLLKNYIFSVANANDLHDTKLNEIEEIWAEIADVLQGNQIADYLRNYWNCSHKTIRKNQLYKIVREEIKTPEKAFSFLRDMRQKADIYMALQNENDELWKGKKDISESLSLLKMFGVTQPLSLLMTAYSELSEKDFETLLKRIVIISFRYNVICQKNPNDEEGLYNKLTLSLVKNHSYNIDELKSGIYISDAEFEQTFAYKEFVYSSRNHKIVKYILSRIENFENGSVIDDEKITLEHILPDNPDESWNWNDMKVQQNHYRLGNMILLEYVKNKNLGNVPFSEKKEVYAQSTIPSTKELGESEIQEWTENEINKRQQKLAKKALGIWRF